MTLTRTNGASWGVGDKFTSSQANGLDIMITNALDKRAGQTDSLASLVSCSGAGRVVDSYVAGANADSTYLLSGANSIINAAASFPGSPGIRVNSVPSGGPDESAVRHVRSCDCAGYRGKPPCRCHHD